MERNDERTGSSAASSDVGIGIAEIDQKQLELRGAVHHRIATLERTVMAREQQVQALQTQLRKLEEDYQYNYNLITERDKAIEDAAAYVVQFDSQAKQANESLAKERQHRASLEQQLLNAQEQLRQDQAQHELRMSEIRRQVEQLQLRHQRELAEKTAEVNETRDEMQRTYSARAAEEEKARSAGIALMEASKRELEDSMRRREASMERELQQWRDKFTVQRDENVVIRQELSAATLEVEQMRSEVSRLERAAEEERRRDEAFRALCTERESQLESTVRKLSDQISSLRCENQRLTTDFHTSKTTLEQLQSRASLVDTTHDAQAVKFTETCEAMRKNYEASLSQLEANAAAVERKLVVAQQANAQLQMELGEAQALNERRLFEVSSLQAAQRDLTAQIGSMRSEKERLQFELQQQRDANTQEAERTRMERDRMQDQFRNAVSKFEACAQEVGELKRELATKAQAHATEVGRLTRELHASESSRHTLEDQIALLHDDHGLQRQLERALREKRDCDERIIQLQRTNEAIRTQVEQFTAELQNDPVVRNAKLNAERVVELECCVKELEGRLAATEEALRRQSKETRSYQEELLSQQGSSRALRQMSDDHARVKRELDELQRARTLALSTEEEGVDNRSVEALKEAEFWRQRAKQLEVALADVAEQRNVKTRELREVQQSLQAAVAEKRSLTDVNSMLKAQLKQAYADSATLTQARVVAAPLMPTAYPTAAQATLAVEERIRSDAMPSTAGRNNNGGAVTAHGVSSTAPRSTSKASSHSSLAGSRATRPTTSWRFRVGDRDGGGLPSADTSRSVSIEGTAVASSKVVRRGSSTVRHYGETE